MQRSTLDVAARVIDALLDGPVTEYGLPSLVGINGGRRFDKARRWLKVFHGRRIIHVSGWRDNPSGAPSGVHPVYCFGRGTDVPKP